MVNDATSHAEEDRRRKEEVDTRNQADSLCYQIERNLEEYKEKLDESTVTDIQAKLKSTRDALASGDSSRIKSEMEALTAASHKMAEKMYQQSGSPGAPEGEAPKASDSNVVDAEFEESNGHNP
jgi:molecular chaperone DnaK